MRRRRGRVGAVSALPSYGLFYVFRSSPAGCLGGALQCIVNSTHLDFPHETRLAKGRAYLVRLRRTLFALSFGLFCSVTRER